MNDPRAPLEADALLAVGEFLRGVERRAAVLAELQSGSAAHGDRALAATMRAFRQAAAQGPLADWRLQFWRLLLATPQLRRPPRSARWTVPFTGLASLGTGLRSVLLLELLGELDPHQSAAALGLPRELHALARRRVMRACEPAGVDPEAIRQLPHTLAPSRLLGLARRRERVLGARHVIALRAPSTAALRRSAPALGVAACALLLAATFLFDRGGKDHRSTPRALPPASRPMATFDADFALLTHRDFEQLATPGDRAFLDNLAFYAWYAAQTSPATDVADAAATVVRADAAQEPTRGSRHGAR